MSNCWRNRTDYYQYTKNRKAMLATNLLTNGGRCALGIEGVCTGAATTAHHTLGICSGMLGPIVPACAACNYALGNPAVHRDPSARPLSW